MTSVNRILSKKPVVYSAVILGSLIFVLLTFSIISLYFLPVSFPGIMVGHIDAGGTSRSSLDSRLSRQLKDELQQVEAILLINGKTEKVSLSSVGAKFDIPATVRAAISAGRTGNYFTRLSDAYHIIRDGKVVDPVFVYDKAALESVVARISKECGVPRKDYTLTTTTAGVELYTGKDGLKVPEDQVVKAVEETLRKGVSQTFTVQMVTDPRKPLTQESLIREITIDPKDAVIRVNHGKTLPDPKDGHEPDTVIVDPHANGVGIAPEKMAAVLKEIGDKQDIRKILPTEVRKPKLNADDVRARLFRDVVGAWGTIFYTDNENNKNRGENIRLAVSHLNNIILAPGETFSFNGILGPRTEKNGYKVAHAYQGGKVVDDVGGGICQVSTTLYNAVLRADMEVTNRTNHMFPVGYVDRGLDATVDYPSGVDFQFKNTLSMPVKIDAVVTSENRVWFTLRGTDDDSETSVEYFSKIIKEYPIETRYVDDPDNFVGTETEKQAGTPGCDAEVYKRILSKDGKIISETKIRTDRYASLFKEILKGTKPKPN